MANPTIRLWDTDSKKPKNAWWSTTISSLNTVLNNNLPSNAVISKAVLKVYADFDGAGGFANVYMKYGFGGENSISTQLGGERKLTGDVTNYDTDITSYMSSKVYPFAISTGYGAYYSVNIYTSNIAVTALRHDYVDLYVEYDIPVYTISSAVSPSGSGTVTQSGTYFESGGTAVLTATANKGWVFKQWNDGNTANPRAVTVTGNATYTAQFERSPYVVFGEVAAAGGGKVTSPDLDEVAGESYYGYFDYGDILTLTATPDEGYSFLQWQDGNTDNPRTVTVTETKTYTATFEKTPCTIVITASPPEGGTVTGGGTYQSGTTITVGATPNKGWYISEWLENGVHALGEHVGAYILNVEENLTFTVIFKRRSYILTLTAENGTITGATNGASYEYGTSLTLKAVADTGYEFVKWSDGVTTDTRTVTI